MTAFAQDVPEFPGLTDKEVEASRLKYGINIVDAGRQSTFWAAAREVVSEPLFIILVFTALIYFLLGEFSEGLIMIIALVFISAISLFQENRSRRAVDSLKKLASPQVKVFRKGFSRIIPEEEVVVGDTIVLEKGNIVPADATVLKANDFSVDESVLTGESLPVFKENTAPHNTLMQGSTIMSGYCVAQVTGIGKQTEFGKIRQSLQQIEVVKTPLQLQIKSFIRSMVIFGVIAFLIVWGINYYMSGDLLHSLLHGLTLAMSVLPEEIPVAFSTFMALGAYHLYKKGVIARSPYTVETLGAATVICTDKTGTITENRMQLAAIYEFAEDRVFDFTREAYAFNRVLEYAMWASETEPFDPMEISIHEIYGEVAPVDKRKDYVQVYEYPLGNHSPIMTHVFSDPDSSHVIAVKGSVEGVLNQCNLPDMVKQDILEKTKQLAKRGYRVLGVGSSSQDADHLPGSQHDLEFDFLGLVGFYDPPKANMRDILSKFYDAGISVKMITGDYPDTALSIADQINFQQSTRFLTGKDVMAMDSHTLRQSIRETGVYARMFPEAKLKVIEALKANGEVVAMTGDGVNDGPALKASHIGIAMGLRGSEVAKNAASLILMDDDLAHMTDAVALGRRIYENLKKAIQYIISIHIPIILIVTLPVLFFWEFSAIFTPIHVIFLELIMGPTCSIVFENEPLERNSMLKPPRQMTSTFFSLRELSVSIFQGLAITAVCLGLGYYFMINGYSDTLVRTIIYTTLIFSNLFLTLVNRSFYYSALSTLRYKNRLMSVIILISLGVLLLSIYQPAIQNIFQFEVLSLNEIAICFVAALLGVIWIEFYKAIRRMRSIT